MSASAATPPRHTGAARQPGRPPRRAQRGLSGLLVIAVLVMLGGLTVYSVGLVTSVHSGYARELSHARARQAASTGAEWGRFRINTGAAAACTPVQSIAALPGQLLPYTVTVRCNLVANVNEAPRPFPPGLNVYQITATACNVPLGGQCPNPTMSQDYVQAQVAVRAER